MNVEQTTSLAQTLQTTQEQCLQLQFAIRGGMTERVFPCCESLLITSRVHQAGMQHVISHLKWESYHSLMDMIFCELGGPTWIGRVKQFYRGMGKSLREWTTPTERRQWDRLLLCSAEIARALHAHGHRETWTQFRLMVLTFRQAVGMSGNDKVVAKQMHKLMD